MSTLNFLPPKLSLIFISDKANGSFWKRSSTSRHHLNCSHISICIYLPHLPLVTQNELTILLSKAACSPLYDWLLSLPYILSSPCHPASPESLPLACKSKQNKVFLDPVTPLYFPASYCSKIFKKVIVHC